jgi:hypothetical protein
LELKYLEGRAGINISTQIKNSVYNVVWDDLDKNKCFKHPHAANILIRPSFSGCPLKKR